MSKRKHNKPVVDLQREREETIKSVFELYKPNKVQLFFMKALIDDNIFTGNTKRVKELSNILGLSKDEVLKLERKYYLGYNF